MSLKNILRGLSLTAALLLCCFALTNRMGSASALPSSPQQRGPMPGGASVGDQPVEQSRKNIQVLKGLPESQLFPVMNFASASLGVRCDFCHVQEKDPKTGEEKWVWESDAKEHKRIGRQMMRMTRDINKNPLDALDGEGVTCYTCHRGTTGALRLPPLPLPLPPSREGRPGGGSGGGAMPAPSPAAGGAQAAPATGAAAATGAPPARPARPTPEQLLQKYVEAVGGRAAIAKIQTIVLKGTREGAQGGAVPLEVALKGNDKLSVVATSPQQGAMTQVLSGSEGWVRNQRGQHAAGAEELTGLRSTALSYAPLKIKEPFPALVFNGRGKVGERDAWVLRATNADGSTVRYFFDAETGLLLRQLTLTPTLLNPLPEQIDFEEYRDVDGVKLPFTIRTSSTTPNLNSTRKFTEIKLNTAVDDALFKQPAAGAKP